MESLLNCAWLLLVVALLTAWAGQARTAKPRRASRLLPSRGLQLTALLVLVVLLFPVISMTDDMAACTAPQEAERALRLHDPLEGAPHAPAVLPLAVSAADLLLAVLSSSRGEPLVAEAKRTVLLEGARLTIDTRPPPAA